MAEIGEPEFMLRFHEALGGREGEYPRVEPFAAQNIVVQVGQIPRDAGSQQHGWKYVSADGDWTITSFPGSLALETSTAYISWSENFRDRLFRVLDAFCQLMPPVAEERLGLRYVDQIQEPRVSDPLEWQEYLDSHLLGLILHDSLGPGVQATLQQVDLAVDDEIRCVVRHGFNLSPGDGSPSYVFDTDTFRDGVRAFDLEGVKEAAEHLSDVSTQVFQQCVTQKLLQHLRGER
jgi:uncharacterized protein (TIGR04255 family)